MITAVGICAAAALICALLVQRSRRRRVEEALRVTEAALRASCQEAQDLAGRLIAAQESERRRLAHELHDNLSQKLALLCIGIQRLGARAAVSPADVAESATHLFERASDIAADVHCLSHDLHPARLDIVGLAPSIDGLCRDVSRECDIRIDFQERALHRRASADATLCLFRITQEALQNVVKHSGAATATVRLAQSRHYIRLHIADSGKGFDRTSNSAGLGLLSMRQRVRFAGGRISIRTAPNRGTRIMVALPLHQELPGSSHAGHSERSAARLSRPPVVHMRTALQGHVLKHANFND